MAGRGDGLPLPHLAPTCAPLKQVPKVARHGADVSHLGADEAQVHRLVVAGLPDFALARAHLTGLARKMMITGAFVLWFVETLCHMSRLEPVPKGSSSQTVRIQF